jgi:hypothetical protein
MWTTGENKFDNRVITKKDRSTKRQSFGSVVVDLLD